MPGRVGDRSPEHGQQIVNSMTIFLRKWLDLFVRS